jgi:hypothetical protein
MLRKLGFTLLRIGAIAYAFGFAPPDRPETLSLIQNLSTGNWEGINPAIVALFNVMGIWPFIYSAVLLFDGRGQKIPAWPFAIASFAVGAFAILPYLAVRSPNPHFDGDKNPLLNLLDSRGLGAFLSVGAVVLLAYGVTQGNWAEFAADWQSWRFIHVMSLDFCLLSLLFPALLHDDMTRRNLARPVVFWIVALVPLLGPLAYLTWRPRIESRQQDISY